MSLAYTMQKFQDWFTQQWVIFFGRRIDPNQHEWLLGPFGNLNGIGEVFIEQLAEKENLIIQRSFSNNAGILSSIDSLKLDYDDLNRLSIKIVDFYEKTVNYQLQFKVKWNPFFIFFGYLVNKLFSNRVNQLNIPISNIDDSEALTNEIIKLVSPLDNQVKYTIWLRKFEKTGKVIYSGIYCTTIIPSGITCVKAVFPLPKGNATVIMKPNVGMQNELILDSSGNKFGDAGFYFLLNDSKGNFWTKFIPSFKDKLIVKEEKDFLIAKQSLKLWGQRVVEFNYKITHKNK